MPGSNPIQDVAGNDAAALDDQAVTKNTADLSETLARAAVHLALLEARHRGLVD